MVKATRKTDNPFIHYLILVLQYGTWTLSMTQTAIRSSATVVKLLRLRVAIVDQFCYETLSKLFD